MGLEKVRDDLRVAAKKFESIQNVGEFGKTNSKEFLDMFQAVLQNYHYIMLHARMEDAIFLEAIDIVDDIRDANPSLSGYVDIILHIGGRSKDNKQKVLEDIDTNSLANKIDSYVTQIDNMVGWDPDEIGDVEFVLGSCRNILIAQKDKFSQELYVRLLDDIDRVLDKIERFNKMMSSGVVDKPLGF